MVSGRKLAKMTTSEKLAMLRLKPTPGYRPPEEPMPSMPIKLKHQLIDELCVLLAEIRAKVQDRQFGEFVDYCLWADKYISGQDRSLERVNRLFQCEEIFRWPDCLIYSLRASWELMVSDAEAAEHHIQEARAALAHYLESE